MSKIGTLFIVSAPSGAGKTSLVKALLRKVSRIQVSVSHTTRAPRPGDQHGIDYYYVTEESFTKMIEKEAFFEYAKVFGNYYGTSKKAVQEALEAGIDVILEIDWQGGRQIRQLFPNAVSVYIMPPSLQELELRLTNRQQDSHDVIAGRMSEARDEMSHFHEFDYLVVNDNFEQALSEFSAIVIANRQKTEILSQNHKKLLEELTQSG